jgi:hypothetical protein
MRYTKQDDRGQHIGSFNRPRSPFLKRPLLLSAALNQASINLPNLVRRAGPAAVFAAEEFFYGAIRDEHTRIAYRRAVDRVPHLVRTAGPRVAAHRARRRRSIFRRAAGGRAACLRRPGNPARHRPESGACTRAEARAARAITIKYLQWRFCH